MKNLVYVEEYKERQKRGVALGKSGGGECH